MPANYVLLGAQTVGAPVASVTLSNIPQSGYTDLKVVVATRTTTGGAADIYVSFNGDTNQANYYMRQLQGNGSSASSAGGSSNQGPVSNGSTDTASTFSNNEMYIPNYTASTYKSFSVDSVTENNATTAYTTLRAVIWNNTSAITSINFVNNGGQNFAEGSTFYLYGTAQVGTTPAIAPYASGGDVIANDGTYWYHAFKTTGAFVPAKALTADILVVAGGGGSYTSPGGGGVGGGGAGGWKAFTSQALGATSYTCTVGAGGVDSNGSNSVFGSLDPAIGGGRGGVADTIGSAGGSGGGTGFRTPSSGTAAGTSGQGNAGGNTSGSYPNYNSGGGGGAGAAGGTGGTNGGAGGIGINTYSSWASATATGDSGYYAGGGGGMIWYSSGSPGAGGTGGGGTGASTSTNTGASGVANTGGGAGGSAQTASAGGSGIVIIRYAMA